LAFFIYEQGFEFFNVGYASALAVIMFFLIVVLTGLQLRLKGGLQ
jgi:multiple sugar transport system permease protein